VHHNVTLGLVVEPPSRQTLGGTLFLGGALRLYPLRTFLRQSATWVKKLHRIVSDP
jgi:hypothetical protein